MKRSRYDLNDKHAYDGRPVVRLAKSPRTEPARYSSTAGTGGNAVSGGANQAATVGQAGAGNGAHKPRYNTMANRRDGGMPITYYAPIERWQETTARTAGHAPARLAPQAPLETHEKTLAAAESAGLRMAAMARHSILRTNGAVDVKPRIGPIWLNDSDSE